MNDQQTELCTLNYGKILGGIQKKKKIAYFFYIDGFRENNSQGF